jgi:hypothetical protein
MAASQPVVIASNQSAVPISAASLPLPTGAATAANQATTNASLASIDAGIPAALGQTTMANSMPVTMASDQSTIPVSVSSIAVGADTRKTFVARAQAAALGNNKSMFSLLNAGGSGVVVRIQKIYLINTQNAAVTGINADFSLFRMTGHSVGTSITPQTHDTADTLSVNVTARTGATIAGEATPALYRWIWGSDEWSTGAADADSADHGLQNLIPLYAPQMNEKAITIRAGEGLTLKQTVNSTSGTFDVICVFTEATT